MVRLLLLLMVWLAVSPSFVVEGHLVLVLKVIIVSDMIGMMLCRRRRHLRWGTVMVFLGGVSRCGVMGILWLLVRMRMMSSTTMPVAVPVSMMVVVGSGRRGHVVATVGQMGGVLHSHLVAMMVGDMTLRCLQQRRLDVGHELGHLGETFELLLYGYCIFLGLGNTCLIFHCSAMGILFGMGLGGGTFICIPEVATGS